MSLCGKVIQELCKMESMIYPLGKLKRLSGFPFPLDEIGMMVNHCAWHKNRVIERYFICIGYNKEKYNSTEVDRRPVFSIIAPGTVMNSRGKMVWHDELFFSYSASITDKLNAVFAPLPPERRRFHFKQDKAFARNLETIRELLNSRMTLGTADKLDVLAMQIILGMIANAGTEPDLEPLSGVLKLEEIAEKLRRGAHLEQLIHQYGYSRRGFYYEWNRRLSGGSGANTALSLSVMDAE